MSLLDQIERQLVDRLRELEPLRREYERLRKAAEWMGIKYLPAASARPGTAQRSSARASSSERAGRTDAPQAAKATMTSEGTRSTPDERARKPRPQARASRPTSGAGGSRSAAGAARRPGRRAPGARPGQRQEEVLALVAERPGITVREIGAQLGVDATGLYRVVNRLTADGRIRKDGTMLHPIEPVPTPGASAAVLETADRASDATVGAQHPGRTDGNAPAETAEAAAGPGGGEAEATAGSAPAQE